MIRDLETARDKLADALWWLRGFAAANVDERATTASDLAGALADVREYLNSMQHGSVRRLGDEKAVVLTYAEFEHLVDACRVDAHREDLARAATTVRSVLKEYGHEAQRARRETNSDNLPF